MSKFSFHGMSESLREKLGFPDLPFPVRDGREAEVFGGTSVDLVALLGELDAFLEENPGCEDGYRAAAVLLSHAAGTGQAVEGYLDGAARCFEIGLARQPDNLTLRADYALALHGLGRAEEALVQYEAVIADPDLSPAPQLWIPAARLHAERGNPARARELLLTSAGYMPEEEEFWDLLAEAEAKTSPEAPSPVPAPLVPAIVAPEPHAPVSAAPPVIPPIPTVPVTLQSTRSWKAILAAGAGVAGVILWASIQYGPILKGWVLSKTGEVASPPPTTGKRNRPLSPRGGGPPRDVRSAPQDVDLEKQAYDLIEAARYEEAVRTFTQALDDARDKSPLYSGRALAYARLGDTEQALKDLDEAQRLDASSYLPHFYRGEICDQLGQSERAVEEYNQAGRLDTARVMTVDIYAGRGTALFNLQRLEEAEQDYRSALALQPDNGQLHANLAGTLFQQGRRDEALKEAQEGIRLGFAEHWVYPYLFGR